MKAFPIIPIKIAEDLQELIHEYCPLSRTEIVDEEIDDEEDEGSRIYKFVGLANREDVEAYVPSRFRIKYSTSDMVLYEKADPDNTAIFWFDGVLVVMISSTDEQHDGVMNLYDDAAALLTQVSNTALTSWISCEYHKAMKKAGKDSQAEFEALIAAEVEKARNKKQ